jgi:hypothetical protein
VLGLEIGAAVLAVLDVGGIEDIISEVGVDAVSVISRGWIWNRSCRHDEADVNEQINAILTCIDGRRLLPGPTTTVNNANFNHGIRVRCVLPASMFPLEKDW